MWFISLSTRSEPSRIRLLLFSGSLIQRLGLLAVLSLAVAMMFVVGCGDGGFGADPKPTLAATSVPPTFVRITVTPNPTDTPTPTPLPSATPEPFEVDIGDPVFPLELDPELVDVRPEDTEIFEGWTKYLTNTSVVNSRATEGTPIHLCAGGRIMTEDGLHQSLQNWRIMRSPAISFLDWGTIAVHVDIVAGRWKGRDWDVLALVRQTGQVFVTNNPTPGEAIIERSEVCLAGLQSDLFTRVGETRPVVRNDAYAPHVPLLPNSQ